QKIADSFQRLVEEMTRVGDALEIPRRNNIINDDMPGRDNHQNEPLERQNNDNQDMRRNNGNWQRDVRMVNRGQDADQILHVWDNIKRNQNNEGNYQQNAYNHVIGN
ncbi:unnamed protein product, partial [Sphenostylis stenocarpa]